MFPALRKGLDQNKTAQLIGLLEFIRLSPEKLLCTGDYVEQGRT